MSIDDQRDLPIEVLAKLSACAVNAALGADTLAHNAVFGEPLDVGVIGANRFPALCVYRASDKSSVLSGTEFQETVTVEVAFVLPPTSGANDRRKERWPALPKAWTAIRNALRQGWHKDCENGARLLDAAELTIERSSFAAKRYGFVDSGTNIYPYVLASFAFDHVIGGALNPTLTRFLRHQSIFQWQPSTSDDAPEVPTENNVVFAGPWPVP